MPNEIPFRHRYLVVLESLICALLLVLPLVGNVLAIVVVFKRLSTTTSLFIAALATTDLINAVIPRPLFLASLITGQMPYTSAGCDIGGDRLLYAFSDFGFCVDDGYNRCQPILLRGKAKSL